MTQAIIDPSQPELRVGMERLIGHGRDRQVVRHLHVIASSLLQLLATKQLAFGLEPQ